MGPCRPDTHNGDVVRAPSVFKNGSVTHRRSEPVTSRQPSVCGGTPPVPRMRNRAATIPVIDSAATTRRTNMNIQRPYPGNLNRQAPTDSSEADIRTKTERTTPQLQGGSDERSIAVTGSFEERETARN